MLGLSEAENVLDVLPVFAVMVVMPLLLLVSPTAGLNHLTVYRVQQYDLHNSRFGSRQSLMNLESISVSQIKESFAKKCVIFKINDLMDKMETFQTIIDETLTAGILVMIPKSVKFLNGLSGQHLDALVAFERSLVSKEIQIPIYITYESKQLLSIYEDQSKNSEPDSQEEGRLSNFERLYDSVMANGYQMVVSAPQTSAIKDLIITNIQGKLIGAGVEDQMPTIALVAHYDAFSAAPSLSFGADSNGSGVVLLLELMRLFSKLYSNPKTQPKVNLLFVMSGAGKFNYLGTKKWIDNQLDNDNSLLSECLFTICMDSLADTDANNGLFMHVSKPPKEGSPAAKLLTDLKLIASKSMPQSFNFSMIHKKINLAEEWLAWEHERFSIRRLFAFTLSSLSSHKSLRRKSLADVYDDRLLDALYVNTKLISEALSRQLYRNIEFDLFENELKVSKPFLKSLLFQISSQSRAQQLVRSIQKGSHIESSSLVASLEQMMRRMLTDVELIHLKVDPKQNELVLYEPTEALLNVYDVKPAIFDLFVSVAIATYLLVFFAILTNFHLISSLTKRVVISNDYITKVQK